MRTRIPAGVVQQYRLALYPLGWWSRRSKKTHTRGSRSSLMLGRQVLPAICSQSGALLPCVPSPSCFLQQRLSDYSHPSFGIVRHASGLRASRYFIFFLYVSPGHESFGCVEDPPVPLARSQLLVSMTRKEKEG